MYLNLTRSYVNYFVLFMHAFAYFLFLSLIYNIFDTSSRNIEQSYLF